MTYCVAIQCHQGLLFAADTRTNAGVDYVTSYRKVHLFTPAPDRVFVLLSAGNLATTRELIDQLGRDLDDAPNSPNGYSLLSPRYLFEAADYVGRVSLQIQEQHGPALGRTGVSGETTLILGGQIKGRPPELLLIYPQGNYIGASDETNFLQIGETKYGKPVLDRLAHDSMTLEAAARLALVSLDATVRSNVTVAAPFDFVAYRRDSFVLPPPVRLGRDDPYYSRVRHVWQQGFEAMFQGLEPFPTESVAVPASVGAPPAEAAHPAPVSSPGPGSAPR